MNLLNQYYQYRNQRFHRRNRSVIIKRYFNGRKVNKLQIGCQGQVVEDWLNVDLIPKSREVALMDATKPFPFENNVFQYIFSEHMIEHITFKEAEFMLKECYRIMKPGGVIRISTPNIQFLMDLYNNPKTEVQDGYIQQSATFIEGKMPLTATSVINNFFKDWGHQYIHDFESLELLLTNAGFVNVQQMEVGNSSIKALLNMEKHGNVIGQKFNLLESIVVEAIK